MLLSSSLFLKENLNPACTFPNTLTPVIAPPRVSAQPGSALSSKVWIPAPGPSSESRDKSTPWLVPLLKDLGPRSFPYSALRMFGGARLLAFACMELKFRSLYLYIKGKNVTRRLGGHNSDYVLITPKPISICQTSFPGLNGEPLCTSYSEWLKLNHIPPLPNEFWHNLPVPCKNYFF